ncbi:unnamed protein product, partial [marine sediment metagenome]
MSSFSSLTRPPGGSPVIKISAASIIIGFLTGAFFVLLASSSLIRIPEKNRDSAESAIYSQYPEAEISIADDYTKYIPQDIPNKDWDLWGSDYKLLKENPYPIKTYLKFETE